MSATSHPETISIVNCTLNAPLILISIIGNTLVLTASWKTPTLRSPSIILVCSLAASDLSVGLVVQPLYIASTITGNPFLFQATFMSGACATGVSLLIMTVISVDRFLALHYHMRYPSLMTTQRAMYTSATFWLISFLLSFSTFWKMSAYYFVSAVTIAICLIVSTFCYIRIYQIVRQHQSQIQAQQQAVNNINAADNKQTMLRSTKSAKNTFIYYIVMIMCYTPLFTSMAVLSISHKDWTNAWSLGDTVAFMNSSINPFLYCWRLRELRTAVIKAAWQMLCRQKEEN